MNELPPTNLSPFQPDPSEQRDSPQSAATHQLPASVTATVATVPGQRYGRFTLQRLHAKGGLGEVHVALDEELQRPVALKRMQARCADDAEARRRFLNEAEITARLEHPGVVPIHGLVQDEHGQPCYAMRFILGQSLGEAIEEFHGTTASSSERFSGLAFRQLLQRFISVCQTMAYAHSRHVIHRDLKPANIMLGPFGETLVVDWGLAKQVISGQLPVVNENQDGTSSLTTDHSPLSTATGQALGTPAYMSPEQAAGRWDKAGPGSDIYSLGATLYEMLTGQRPIQGSDAFDALEKALRGGYAPPRHWQPHLPKALEAICLKAMAVSADARYATALALADDVEHWLADEPVCAYAEPWPVRAGRWLRRHRALVTTAAAVLFTATVGLAAGLFFVNAERQRTDQARVAAEQSEEKAKVESATATAVKEFLQFDLLQFAAPRVQSEQALTGVKMDPDLKVRDLVTRAERRIADRFVAQPLVEAEIRYTLGWTLNDMGRAAEAVPQWRRAQELYAGKFGPDHPDTLRSMHYLANSYEALGRHAEALKLREETLARRTATLGPAHLDTLMSMNNLASTYRDLGRHAEAVKLCGETVTLFKAHFGLTHPRTLLSMNNLSLCYMGVGRFADALKLSEETLTLRKATLGPDHPDTLWSMSNLANCQRAMGRYADALKLDEETLALRQAKLGPDHPDTLWSMNNLADTYHELGRKADALALREETLRLRKAKLGPDHPDTLNSMNELARSYAALGRHAEALQLKEETLALRKAKLGPDHADTILTMGNLANSYFALGRHAEAKKLYEEEIALAERCLAAQPNYPEVEVILAVACVGLGNLLTTTQHPAEALDYFGKAIPPLSTVMAQEPNHASAKFYLRNAYWSRAATLDFLERHAEAVKDWDRALSINTAAADAVQIRTQRAGSLARAGEHAKAIAEANALAAMPDVTNGTLYELAAVCAVAAAVVKDDAKLQDQYGARAVELLRQAVAKGYKDADHMKSDTDLGALRQREDFRKLVEEMERKK